MARYGAYQRSDKVCTDGAADLDVGWATVSATRHRDDASQPADTSNGKDLLGELK